MARDGDDLIRALLSGLPIDQALPLDRVAPLDPGSGGTPVPAVERSNDDEPRGPVEPDAAAGFDWSRAAGPPDPDVAWSTEVFAEYQARWPDRDREAGQRYLGSLGLGEDESRQLVERVAYVVRAHAPLSVPRFRKLAGSETVWNAWAAIFTLAVVEFAYRWEPEDDDVRGFWGACLRRFGDSSPDDLNHHSAARALLGCGFEVWGLRRAADDAYRYVTTVMLQSGVPRRSVPAFRNLLEAAREEHGWDRLARESAIEVARRIGAIGRQRWPTSSLRHLLGGERGWDSPHEAAGELVRGLARLARFCEQAGKDADKLTDAELQSAIQIGAGSVGHFRDWRRIAEVLRRSSAAAVRRDRPWLAWSPDEGIVSVFPRQAIDLEDGDATALLLRVGEVVLARQPVVLNPHGSLYLPDRQIRLSRIDGPVVWELVDGFDQPIDRWRVAGIGEDGCRFLVLDPRRETLQVEPQRLRDLSGVVLLAPRACLTAAKWPSGVEATRFDGAVGLADWGAVQLRRHVDEVVVSIGDRRFVWFASAAAPRLCGWRVNPATASPPSFLDPPRLWLPAHLAHTRMLVDGQPLAAELPREVHPDGSVSVALDATAGWVDVAAAGRGLALSWQVAHRPSVLPPERPRWTLIADEREYPDRGGVWPGEVGELVRADLRVEGLWPGDVFELAVVDDGGRRQGQVEVVADRHGRAEAGLIALAEFLRPRSRPAGLFIQGVTWRGTYPVAGTPPAPGTPRPAKLPPTPVADGYAPPDLVADVVRLASAWAVADRPLAVRRATLAAAVQDAFPPPRAPAEEQVLAAIEIAIERGELRVVPDGYVAPSRPILLVTAAGSGFATGHRALGHWLAERQLGIWQNGQGGDPPAIELTPALAGDLLAIWANVVALEDLVRHLPRPRWPKEPGRRIDEPYPEVGWESLDLMAAHPTWRLVTPTTRRPAASVLRQREGSRYTYRWWADEAMWAPDPAGLAEIRWLVQTLGGHVRIVAVPADLPSSNRGWYHIGCPYWLPREHWDLLRRFSFPALDRGRLVAPRHLGIVRRIFASLGATVDLPGR